MSNFDEWVKMLGYAAPFLCVLLGFILNNTAQSMRAANDRRATDVEYRTRILTHVDYVEKRLSAIDDSMHDIAEFRGQVNAFIDAVDGRLLRIERKLDCEADQ